MAKAIYRQEELERQLSESRREFWAADATINNLELKLAEMAEQLANKEKRIAELESLTAPQLPQPSPVVPAALPENDDDDVSDIGYLDQYEVYALGRTAGWNACRAAMLQCSEPVTDNTNQQFESLSRGDK